jgi:hypothetical protein
VPWVQYADLECQCRRGDDEVGERDGPGDPHCAVLCVSFPRRVAAPTPKMIDH